MPAYRVPHKLSAHRHATKALYRALLAQCRASPLLAAERAEMQNVIRNRFKQAQGWQSRDQLRLSLQAGYEAIDHLDAAVAGDGASTAFLRDLLSRAPARVKLPPPLSSPREAMKAAKTETGAQPPVSTPSSSLFDRPLPAGKLSGRRHVPRLVNASSIPMLRIKKPQPESLSGFIQHRVKQRERRHDRRHALLDDLALAANEDAWDRIVADASGEEKVGGPRAGEPEWVRPVRAAIDEVTGLLSKEQKKNAAMAEKMQAVVDRDQAAYDKEKAERRLAREKERELPAARAEEGWAPRGP